MRHDALAQSLAQSQWSTRVVLTEFTLGPSVGVENHPGRVDVLTLARSYRRMDLTIYEIKTSRADFLRDVESEKWRKYLDFCHRLLFAAPRGLILRQEVPRPAGLIEFEDGWQVTRGAAPTGLKDIPQEFLQAVAFASQQQGVEHRRLRELRDIEVLLKSRETFRRYGYLRSTWAGETMQRAAETLSELQSLRHLLLDALEMSEQAEDREIVNRVRFLKQLGAGR